jgi:hypothetical protein
MPEPIAFTYDARPWLQAQQGLPAVRARRQVGLTVKGDEEAIAAAVRDLGARQCPDGSIEDSPLATAGALILLADLQAGAAPVVAAAAAYLFSVLAAQPGSSSPTRVLPGKLDTPCDLGGFFGPYAERALPEALARGAREMNRYRVYEPLLGPGSPVRAERRSSRDRPGPGSCYAWGLIPLCYTVEALCRAGYGHDARLAPATDALLGAQRESGGWCRNLGGHPSCSMHAVRALGAHPALRESAHAGRALAFLQRTQASWAKGARLFAGAQAAAAFPLPVATPLLRDLLAAIAPRQQRNGTFGAPHRVERVAAALIAARAAGMPFPSTA